MIFIKCINFQFCSKPASNNVFLTEHAWLTLRKYSSLSVWFECTSLTICITKFLGIPICCSTWVWNDIAGSTVWPVTKTSKWAMNCEEYGLSTGWWICISWNHHRLSGFSNLFRVYSKLGHLLLERISSVSTQIEVKGRDPHPLKIHATFTLTTSRATSEFFTGSGMWMSRL